MIDEKSRAQRQAELASTEPSFDLKVEAKKVRVEYQNLKQATVNYYLMDIELLFSRNPFVQGHSNQFSQILPNFTDTIQPAADQRSIAVPVARRVAEPQRTWSKSSARDRVQVASLLLQLAVRASDRELRPLASHRERDGPAAGSKVYVKAYARMKDGKRAILQRRLHRPPRPLSTTRRSTPTNSTSSPNSPSSS